MKVDVAGKSIDLSPKDFQTSGGEGKIYAKGGVIYKLYNDPSKMIPAGKIAELNTLTLPCVIKPQQIIEQKGKPVGFTMNQVKGYPLCQVFTKAFRQRENITKSHINHYVLDMIVTTEHIHSKNILIADYNELNFLIENGNKKVFFIDVNSYQTPHYPATALMESIRDRHSKGFTKGTDWFGFAIVTFQMYIGIHPYKGRHTLKTLDERMTANVSVFNKDVKIPAVCEDFSILPPALADWYKSVFEKGERSEPPTDFTTLVMPMVISTPKLSTTIKSGQKIEVKVYQTHPFDIAHYSFVNGMESVSQGSSRATFTPQGRKLTIDYTISTSNDVKITFSGNLSSCNVFEGRIYRIENGHLVETTFMEINQGKLPIPTDKIIANVLDNARLYDGVMFQNVLAGPNDTSFASFFPQKGLCYQLKLVELSGHKVINAKYERGLLVVTAAHNGQYSRFLFKIALDFSTYSVTIDSDVDSTDINFAVLSNGIVVLSDGEEWRIFSNKIGADDVKVVADNITREPVRLYAKDSQLLGVLGCKIYTLKLK